MSIPRFPHWFTFVTLVLIASGASAQIVPFIVQVEGGICNTAAVGSANPEIVIEGGGLAGPFMVTSVLLKTDSIPLSGFFALSVNSVTIDGTRYDTVTGNLVGHVDGTGVDHSFDIMGTPVRVSGSADGYAPGGNFPHQIVATSPDLDDIRIRFFCRTDIEDLNIDSIAVSGWKRLAETISVIYVPGN